jgi:hypothetical protein
VTGDFGPVYGEGSAYTHLEYDFRVTKTKVEAPDVPVPIRISAHAEGSLVRLYGATQMPRWKTWLGYRYGTGSWESLMGLPMTITYDDSFENSIDWEGVRNQMPGVEGRLHLTNIGEVYGTYCEWQGGTFDVTIDPSVRIDPAFLVEVGGVSRPGTVAGRFRSAPARRRRASAPRATTMHRRAGPRSRPIAPESTSPGPSVTLPFGPETTLEPVAGR